MNQPDLLPSIPSPLAEASAAALEWPRLRDHIAGRTWSPVGRAWTLALTPSADLAWIETQHQRTQEMQSFLAAGGTYDFHGLFDPTELLDKARIDGAALEALEILSLLTVVERISAWRNLIFPTTKSGDASNPSLLSFRSGAEESASSSHDARVPHPSQSHREGWDSTTYPRHETRPPSGIAALSAPLRAHDLNPLLNQLRGKIEPDGSLSDDASPELRRIRRAMERQHRAIEESLRRSLRKLTDDGSTQDSLITIRGERFVIPVRAEFKRKVPGVIHGSSSSGQTVFVEPLDTIEQNNELVRLLDEEQSEIHRILVALTRALAASATAIYLGTAILAEVESHTARARFAIDLRCTRPVFANGATDERVPHLRAEGAKVGSQDTKEEPQLSLTAARHPLLELRMQAEDKGASPIPLTLTLPNDARQLIISGPNTGGKTVSLKTVGLLSLMAQAGVPVPAEEAKLPLFTAIFADIGDAQSIERNLSSFSAHVVNLDRISREATSSSLVLLDELGSATDPEEGAALAVAVAEHFLQLRAWCCITTHLTSLKVYAANHAGVLNAAVGFDAQTLTPTYQLRLGVPGASAGLNIAARLGLSPAIIAAARAQLTTQTADIGAFLDQLHSQLTAATEERNSLRLREAQLTRDRARLETEGRAEQKARTKELEAKLNSLMEDFAYQIRETVKSIDDKALSQKIARNSATTLARLRREFSEQFNSTVVAHTTGADRNDPNARPHVVKGAAVGDVVKLKSLGRQARVERVIDAKTFEVSMGPMKMRVPIDDIAEVEQVKSVTPLEAARKRGGVTVSTAQDPDYTASEINVIGRTADEAHDEVERFLDRAFLAGLPRIRIVHGTGMGILRRTLRDYLRNHPHVANVTEPPQNQGGQGATEVELRQ
ncbi:endonuclease MutS2 [Edaphobacter bradus]|uniref:endonuclease MutS2 n=1 Tax=Edaphobacter bradus TaxID=2259016 RepID=UPI0021DFA767|nr:Smr/MutS family protein [Edaphobacter bradus]